ncbi:unnamed protein product [Calicophoron daubneyi]|uniref:Myosin motor domain-containing protein n=1 Tax=Calicophoron daubneyi TaxID=300641 RepID=A0AAV2T3C3_CALDB
MIFVLYIQGKKERNYHVFYELLSSLDNSSKQRHHLRNVEDYQYLCQGDKLTYTTHSDPDGLAVLLESWRTLGLPTEEMDLCLRVVSAILHLGNIVFKPTTDGEKVEIVNPKVLRIAASELGVDSDELGKVITMKLTETARDSMWSPVTNEQVTTNRDSIARQLYSEFFSRLLVLLNSRLAPPDPKELHANARVNTVALLDIYGFENFPVNSLEQFCINYTNENLQRFFNLYIFELEQSEYAKEEISWEYIKFPDNQAIIDLIAGKPHGIIHLCNDAASLASGTDESFVQKCQSHHRGHPNFVTSKVASLESFIVVHFAGGINYSSHGFVNKNRERMRGEVLDVLCRSKQPAVSKMFKSIYSRRSNSGSVGPKLKTPMVLSEFHESLQSLLGKMQQSRPHFVRCIKPNMSKTPMDFQDSIVLDQLRYTGVLEATRIRKSGFPVRQPYADFVRRYGVLLTRRCYQALSQISDPMEAAEYILGRLSLPSESNGAPARGKDYQMGKTKLFIRSQLAVFLDSLYIILENHSARTIQHAWRRREGGLYKRAIENAAIVIQSYYRGYLTRRMHPEIAEHLANYNSEPLSEGQVKPLSDQEIAELDIPGDLAFILQEHLPDQNSWLITHKVTRPKGSIHRLQLSLNTDGWHTYGRPVWDAQPLSFLLGARKTTFLPGYRLTPRQHPVLLNHASEIQRSACVAGSKLMLRLVHLPNQPILEQFLVGSYLYQLALTQKPLQKELLVQLLSQVTDWPEEPTNSHDSDDEDETSLFTCVSGFEDLGVNGMLGSVNGDLVESHDVSAIGSLRRRAYRRLWMHVAGLLTCGQLSNTLKPIIVRFLRQHGPPRSVPVCEDRLVSAPSLPRLYPPCMLEWRVNFTGNNMSVSVTYPDGLVSVIHVGCFTKAEKLAGLAMALRTRSMHALPGWTLNFHTENRTIDLPGYSYVMDVFSLLELPAEWSQLNSILPDHVFPTYWENADGLVIPKTVQSSMYFDSVKRNELPNSAFTTNCAYKGKYNAPPASEKPAYSDHGLEKKICGANPSAEKKPTHSGRISLSNWHRAVRKMAQKRFVEVSPSESKLHRANSRKERQWRSKLNTLFPRPRSPADVMADESFARDTADLSFSNGGVEANRQRPTVPHGMLYYTYDQENCILHLRKEFISPAERIRCVPVLNMIFLQVVKDAVDRLHPRLRPEDRRTVLDILALRTHHFITLSSFLFCISDVMGRTGDRLNLCSIESLLRIPLPTRKKLVRSSMNFPFYFGQFYPVMDTARPPSPIESQWLVISHHGIRLVMKRQDEREFRLDSVIGLGEVKTVQASRVRVRPRWLLGDATESGDAEISAVGILPKSTENGTKCNNCLTITETSRTHRFYSDVADRICEVANEFLREYSEEMTRLKEAAERRDKHSVDQCAVLSPSVSNCSTRAGTPESSLRYSCGSPLLTTVFPQRDFSFSDKKTPLLRSESTFSDKPSPVGTKLQANSSPPSTVLKIRPNNGHTSNFHPPRSFAYTLSSPNTVPQTCLKSDEVKQQKAIVSSMNTVHVNVQASMPTNTTVQTVVGSENPLFNPIPGSPVSDRSSLLRQSTDVSESEDLPSSSVGSVNGKIRNSIKAMGIKQISVHVKPRLVSPSVFEHALLAFASQNFANNYFAVLWRGKIHHFATYHLPNPNRDDFEETGAE